MSNEHETPPEANRVSHRTGNASADARRTPTMSVLHIVSSLSVGGMEQVVLRLAKAQTRVGHNVAVLALRGGPLISQFQDAGINTHALGGSRATRLIGMSRHVRAI